MTQITSMNWDDFWWMRFLTLGSAREAQAIGEHPDGALDLT
jgi:hypothetical protein